MQSSGPSVLGRQPDHEADAAGGDTRTGRGGARHLAPTRRRSARERLTRWGTDPWVSLVIAAYALAVYLPYDLRASFFLDDYAMVEHFRLGTPLPTFRPTFRLEMAAAYRVLGLDARGYYVALGLLAAAVGVLLFLSLRSLGLAAVPAALAGVLVVAYPRADSTTLWWSTPAATALALGLASVLLGSAWTRRSGGALRWLVPCLACMAAAVLCYESVFPLFVLTLCFLPLAARPRRSLAVAAMEGAAAIGCALYMLATEATAKGARGPAAWPARAWQLARDGWQAYVVHGLGRPDAAGLALAAAVAVAMGAVFALRQGSWRGAAGRPPGRLLLVETLLLLAVGVALVPFLPSNAYYQPLQVTFGNRVNALPQVFVVTALALGIWLVAGTIARWRPSAATLALTAVAGVVVAGGFAAGVRADESSYLSAGRIRAAVLTEVHRLQPTAPPPGTTVLLGDFSRSVGPSWLPTIENAWDATAALQLVYATTDFQAANVDGQTRCLDGGVLTPLLHGGQASPYRSTVVVDVGRRALVAFAGRSQCQSALPGLLASP